MDKVDELLLEFIHIIYGCSSGTHNWQDFIDRFSKEFPAVKLVILGYDSKVESLNFGVAGNYDPAFVESYWEHYFAINPWNAFHQDPTPLSSNRWTHDILPQEELEKTEFYNDWVKPQGDVATGFACYMMKSRHSVVSINCNVNFKHISEAMIAREYLLRLEPHIQQSFAMMRRLGGNRLFSHTLEKMLDKMDSAQLIVDENHYLIYANQKAEELLRDKTVIAYRTSGHLQFVNSSDQENINHLMRQLNGLAFSGKRAAKLAASAGKDYVATVSLLVKEGSNVNGNDIVFFAGKALRQSRKIMITLINMQQEPVDPEDIMMELFNLTEAEVRLAQHLGKGITLKECADEIGIAYNTARSHLKKLFEKMDVSSQSALVLKLSRLLG